MSNISLTTWHASTIAAACAGVVVNHPAMTMGFGEGQGAIVAQSMRERGTADVIVNDHLPLYVSDTGVSYVEGIRLTREACHRWCDELQACGVSMIRRVICDVESYDSSWNLPGEVLYALSDDPAYRALARAANMPGNPSSLTDEQRVRFDVGLVGAQKRLLKDVVYAAIKRRFPGAVCCNWNDYPLRASDVKYARDLNGWPYYGPPSGADLHCPAVYGNVGALKWAEPSVLTGSGQVAYSTNRIRGCLRAAPSTPVLPWLGRAIDSEGVLDEAHYGELVIRALLLSLGDVALFNPHHDAAEDAIALANDALIVRAIADLQAQLKGRTLARPIVGSLVHPASLATADAAVLSDGSTLVRATLAEGAKPQAVKVGGRSIRVAREDGLGCWRSVD